MTVKKLFWDNPYLTECDATVKEVNGNRVKLDRTVFFAFSGGQASDSGDINGLNVTEATKQGDKENIIDIEYVLEKEPDFKVGDNVKVRIDENRRKNIMRLHTALHIAYYIIIEELGKLRIFGSNVSPEKARVDFLYEGNLSEALPRIEERLNNFISEDHEIRRETDKENPDLRWWLCDKWKMPCGGTHVKSTKEIGKIRLKRKTKGSGKERIEVYLEG